MSTGGPRMDSHAPSACRISSLEAPHPYETCGTVRVFASWSAALVLMLRERLSAFRMD